MQNISLERATYRILIVAIAAMVTGWLSTFVDFQLAQWCRAESLFFLRKLVEAPEPLGTTFGVLLVLLLATHLSWPKTQFPRSLAFGLIMTELLTFSLKLSIPRIRPVDFDFAARTSSMLSWAQVQGWENRFQSFPSAHTSTVFCMATIFSFWFPRGTLSFFFLASLVGIQRVVSEAHFLSDVCVGAGIGYVMGTITCWLWSTSDSAEPADPESEEAEVS